MPARARRRPGEGMGFGSPNVGDPLNAVKIFNEKEADELMVLDMDRRRANENQISPIARLRPTRVCRCATAVVSRQHSRRRECVGLGIEKVAMSSAAIEDPQLVAAVARMRRQKRRRRARCEAAARR